jgi:hypothetical protein
MVGSDMISQHTYLPHPYIDSPWRLTLFSYLQQWHHQEHRGEGGNAGGGQGQLLPPQSLHGLALLTFSLCLQQWHHQEHGGEGGDAGGGQGQLLPPQYPHGLALLTFFPYLQQWHHQKHGGEGSNAGGGQGQLLPPQSLHGLAPAHREQCDHQRSTHARALSRQGESTVDL